LDQVADTSTGNNKAKASKQTGKGTNIKQRGPTGIIKAEKRKTRSEKESKEAESEKERKQGPRRRRN